VVLGSIIVGIAQIYSFVTTRGCANQTSFVGSLVPVCGDFYLGLVW